MDDIDPIHLHADEIQSALRPEVCGLTHREQYEFYRLTAPLDAEIAAQQVHERAAQLAAERRHRIRHVLPFAVALAGLVAVIIGRAAGWIG